jgi:RHS repeat-associated protein
MNNKTYKRVKQQIEKSRGKLFIGNTIEFEQAKDGRFSERFFSPMQKLVCIVLLTSLFSMPVLAAAPDVPRTITAALGEINQDVRFNLASGNIGTNILSRHTLELILRPFSTKKQTAPKSVVILPGDDISVLQGEKINFSGIGLDGDNQPMSGLEFKWTVQDTGRNRPVKSLPDGTFTASVSGTFLVIAESRGKQARATITVNPNEGYFVQKMLQKGEAEKSDKEKQQTGDLKEKGILVSREISSKHRYRLEDEKQLDRIDREKQREVKTRQTERRNQNPNAVSGNQNRLHGPNAGETEMEYQSVSAEPLAENAGSVKLAAAAATAAASAIRPITDDGWDGGNWYTADDPVNQVGNPPGAAPAAGAGNGNFQFAAPVASFAGRAGLDVNLALAYNSRLWSKSGSYINYDSDKGFPGPGWSLGFGKMMRMGGTGGCMLVTPDGTRHSYNGTNSTYSSGSYYSNSYTGHTTDNSFVDYSCSYSSSTYGTSLSGSATLSNGTIVTYSSPTGVYDQIFPTQITDAQGNYITITYVNNQGPNIQTVTDTLGRVITFDYDSLNRLVSVTGPGVGGTTRTLLRLHYSQLNLNYAFASGIYPDTPTNTPYVLDAIYYPVTNTGYWFGDADSYSSYGMIAKVVEERSMSWSGAANDQGTITPGAINRQQVYNFTLGPNASLTDAPDYTTLTETWANMDTAAAVTSFNVIDTPTDEIITVVAPNGTKSRQTSHTNPGAWDDGMYYQNETLAPDDTVLNKTKSYLAPGDYGSSRPTRIETTDEKNQTTAAEFSYAGNYNQVVEQREYNYGGALYRKANTAYENNAAYTNRHIFNLVKSTELYDGAGARLSKTDYEYDNNAVVNGAGNPNLQAAPGVIMHKSSYDPYTTETVETPGYCETWQYNYPECSDGITWAYVGGSTVYCPGDRYCSVYSAPTSQSAYDPNTVYRGNVTRTTTYADAASLTGAIAYDSTYDITGNARTTTTNCCQQMSFNYTTNMQYSQPEQHTKGSSDPNSPDRMTESATYDFNTGVNLTATDFNGRTTTTSYDAIARQTLLTLPTGGKKTIEYGDSTLSLVETVQNSDNSIVSKSLVYFNGRGQPQHSAYKAGPGGAVSDWNATTLKYDAMGRKWQASMPYTGDSAPSQWTTYGYDALSRASQVTAPDGSTSKTFYNEASRPVSASSAAGQTVRSQDAWGRERWARTDDFGRVAEVVEPNPAGSGGVFEAGSLQTNYAYSAKDELTQVTQGEQQRWFAYDSLGRLTRQKLAEQTATINDAGQFAGAGGAGARWSDAFFYDARSNLVQRVDARGVKSNFNYQSNGAPDPLNRLLGVSYDSSGAGATPVSIEYMPNGDKTRVWKVTAIGMSTEENVYDIESRISEYRMFFAGSPSNVLTTSYLYDTVSRLTEVRYPAQYGVAGSPRKVVNIGYDEASRLKQLNVNNQIQMNEIVYNPMSQVTQLKTGASTGNADLETYGYDNQTGLLTNQTVVKANTGQSLLNLSYEYNRGSSNGSLNGKTGQLTHIVDNLDRNKDRVYEFDALSRLRTAKGGAATGIAATANWTQSYSFDRYGNRETVQVNGVTADYAAVPTDGIPNLSYNTSSNRINTAGYEYDLAGNQTRGQNAYGAWQRYEYDAAGRLALVKSDGGVQILSNAYGSSRQRLYAYEAATNEYTVYAWGGDAVLAEYTVQPSNVALFDWKKSYVYAGSRLLSTQTNNNQGGEVTEFHHPDRLGTKLVTNNQAYTSFEQATLPFGTSLDAESSGITNQRFTSYDRNSTTGLDYAVNRSYSSAQSRFTSVDPIGMDAASIGNPQSNNLYAYVQNNPIDLVDPTGLWCTAVTTVIFNEDGTINSQWTDFGDDCFTFPSVGGGGSGGGIMGGRGGGGGGGGSGGGGGIGGIITPIESPVDRIINNSKGKSAKEKFIEKCITDKVQDRVQRLNRERDLELDKSILGSMAPSPMFSPFGVLSPSSKAIRPGREDDKDELGMAAIAGIIENPIGAGGNVLGAGVYEGTYGFYNFRTKLNKINKVTQEDKNDCEKQAANLP